MVFVTVDEAKENKCGRGEQSANGGDREMMVGGDEEVVK